MKYYKIVTVENDIVCAVSFEYPMYIRWLSQHSVFVSSGEYGAQGIMLADGAICRFMNELLGDDDTMNYAIPITLLEYNEITSDPEAPPEPERDPFAAEIVIDEYGQVDEEHTTIGQSTHVTIQTTLRRAVGDYIVDEAYSSTTPIPIEHGLGKKPKIYYCWVSNTSSATRVYDGNIYLANYLGAFDVNALSTFSPTYVLDANAPEIEQQGLFGVEDNDWAEPDDTYLYIYTMSATNTIPAGTVIHWEAIAW